MVDILAERNPGYLSIAGAQDKFPAIVRDNQIYLALTGQPTTHIIKPPISRFKESVYNEYFCMRLAQKVGLNVPDVQVLTGSIPLFVIERFDRIERQNMISRLHQQDFCQALGFSSSYKYEQNGGPSFADCFQCVKQYVHYSKKSSNLFALLDWFCFNLLIGNNESHAKNLSLLLSSETYELTPFYDLLCTVIYPTLKRDFAFQIGGRYDVLSLSTNHIQKLETELDVRSGTILHHLQRMWNTLQLEMPILLEEIELELSDCKIARRIMLQIQKRAKGFRTIGLT
jgi:serine/threonine-protein kinase HipA